MHEGCISSTSPFILYTNLKYLSDAFSLSSQRVHLDIQIGEQAVNYPEVAAREKLGELQLRIRQLLDQIEQISKEQVYQRVSITLSST